MNPSVFLLAGIWKGIRSVKFAPKKTLVKLPANPGLPGKWQIKTCVCVYVQLLQSDSPPLHHGRLVDLNTVLFNK